MRHLRFVALSAILLLAIFPVALYAETGHEGHGVSPAGQAESAPAAGQNLNSPSGSGQNTVTQGSSQKGQTVTPPAAVIPLAGQSHDSHGSAPAAPNASVTENHEMHGSAATGTKSSSTESHDQHGTAAAGEESSEGDHQSGGHGGESKPNPLAPVKNGIVAGFAIFNGLMIIGAMIMKKKTGQEV